MNTNANFKTGQIWTNAHRSNDGKKTTNGAEIVYQRIDEVCVSIEDGKMNGYVNTTDVNTGKQHCIEIDDFIEKKTLFSDVA